MASAEDLWASDVRHMLLCQLAFGGGTHILFTRALKRRLLKAVLLSSLHLRRVKSCKTFQWSRAILLLSLSRVRAGQVFIYVYYECFPRHVKTWHKLTCIRHGFSTRTSCFNSSQAESAEIETRADSWSDSELQLSFLFCELGNLWREDHLRKWNHFGPVHFCWWSLVFLLVKFLWGGIFGGGWQCSVSHFFKAL